MLGVLAVAVATVRSLVVPRPRPMDDRLISLDTAAQTVTLNANAETRTPGRFGLFVSGTYSYLKLGEVIDQAPGQVTRALVTPVGPGDEVAHECSFSVWYFDQPDELGIEYRDVVIPTPAGDCPAWFFPTQHPAVDPTTWVIHIHGRGVRRAECLRAVAVFRAAGLPSLIASYRNDGEGAATARGAYGLGSTEWQDVEAAIAYAIEHGAQSVILQGYSMGGAIAFQTLLRSTFRDRILGLVLDSPVVDWKSVLAVHAHEGRVPGPIAKLAMQLLRHPVTARLCGADEALPLDAMNMNARSGELDVPILLLVSSGDSYVPDGPAIALSLQRPDIVTRVQFSRPPHTGLWNYDQALWNDSVGAWLRANRFA